VSYRTVLLAGILAALTLPAHAASGAPGHSHGHSGAAHGATHTDGAPGKAADVKRVVTIEARDTAFNVKQIQVRAGETIKFVIVNKGQLAHEFSIASPKEQEAHRAMMRDMPDMVHEEPNLVTVKPGETKELIWRFGKDTEIEFACNVPGHAEQGMKGVFRVMR
jgi:uncharacterized cupredoxin-like copper-binding protein